MTARTEYADERRCAPEVGDDSMIDLIADAKGLDQPEVLVLAVRGLDGAQERAAPIWHYIYRLFQR